MTSGDFREGWVRRIAEPLGVSGLTIGAPIGAQSDVVAVTVVALALGWHLSPELAAYTPRGGALLQITLRDASGVEIRDATVKVAAFFNARANDVIDTTLTRDFAGYNVRLPVTHGGVWELQFDVTRGSQRFTATSRVEAVAAGNGT